MVFLFYKIRATDGKILYSETKMKKGFSLFELLLVLVILGTLMAWVLPPYLHKVEEEHHAQQSVVEQARALQGALNAHGQQQQLQLDQLEQTLHKLQKTKKMAPKNTTK